MKFNTKTLALAAALAGSALAAPAFAHDAGGFTLGVTAGSLGVGPELTYDVNAHLAVRGSATFLAISHDFSTNSLHYDGRADLASGGVVLDYKPFGGGFLLSAGVRYDGNTIKATATPMAPVTINGVAYTPAQVGVLSANATFPSVAPTLSLGYRFHPTRDVVFGLEAGAMFMGGAKIGTPTFTGAGMSPTDLEAERAKLQSQVDKYQTYPLLQATLAYRF
jgi:hypothetical protein